jgi:hypothetical protein
MQWRRGGLRSRMQDTLAGREQQAVWGGGGGRGGEADAAEQVKRRSIRLRGLN